MGTYSIFTVLGGVGFILGTESPLIKYTKKTVQKDAKAHGLYIKTKTLDANAREWAQTTTHGQPLPTAHPDHHGRRHCLVSHFLLVRPAASHPPAPLHPHAHTGRAGHPHSQVRRAGRAHVMPRVALCLPGHVGVH